MKKTLYALVALAMVGMAYGEEGDLTQNDVDRRNLTLDDVFANFHSSKGDYRLSAEEQQATLGKDVIIAGLFTDKSGWVQQISADDRSYIGIERADAGSKSDAFSCAGAYATGTTLGDVTYKFVFNRADPESNITTKELVPFTTEYQYVCKAGSPATFTPEYLMTCLQGGDKAAIALLRTPSPTSDDMLAVSILHKDTQEIENFVVACEVSAVGDDSAIASVAYDPQRLQSAVAFRGEKYGYEDIIAANEYILKGHLPDPTPVPEPVTGTLSLLGLAALAARRRRK